eukprot:9891005-Alexandrium_andersonii.AAC.1
MVGPTFGCPLRSEGPKRPATNASCCVVQFRKLPDIARRNFGHARAVSGRCRALSVTLGRFR